MTERGTRMAEYICKAKLKEAFEEDGHLSAYVEEMIDSIPAADVRPVVLCRDCKWCHAGYCEKYDDLIPFGCANKPWEDWFCADGKKKEES